MRITKARPGTIAFAAVGIAFAGDGPAFAQTAEHYRNFNSAIYVPIDDMRRMAADPKFMQESFDVVHASIKFNKVWLETYRWDQEIGEADVRKVKQFFESKGIRTSGGIMAGGAGRWHPVFLLGRSSATRALPQARSLYRQHFRRTNLRRPVHVQLPRRTGSKSSRKS